MSLRVTDVVHRRERPAPKEAGIVPPGTWASMRSFETNAWRRDLRIPLPLVGSREEPWQDNWGDTHTHTLDNPTLFGAGANVKDENPKAPCSNPVEVA